MKLGMASVDTARQTEALEFPIPTVEKTLWSGRKRTFDVFYASNSLGVVDLPNAAKTRVATKLMADYKHVAFPVKIDAVSAVPTVPKEPLLLLTQGETRSIPTSTTAAPIPAAPTSSTDLVVRSALSAVDEVVNAVSARHQPKGVSVDSAAEYAKVENMTAKALSTSRAMVARRTPSQVPEPKWHAPWKLMRVVSAHLGWVRAIAMEPGNEWFATGSADRTIKIWDTASGTLRVTLTGHINTVRALAVSNRHPYLFSAAEDKMVKCWDLETNKTIRHYHGHLSGVYALALHPTLDILMTGGRDSVCRVWDMRTKAPIHVLSGHENSIASILANSVDPQVITGSMDNTIRLWDLAAGRVRTVLTHHKKSIRGMAAHPKEFCFISGGADNIKKWALPDGVFVNNFSGHNAIINAVAANDDDVVVSGGDNGTLRFWDYKTGCAFQDEATKVQPGSLESEAGILAMTFDMSGSRLITAEADKTIKVWKEDPDASPETHPIDMKAWTDYYRSHKRY